MIRSLELKCSKCSQVFTAKDKLYYQDDFTVRDFKNIKLLCADCVRQWELDNQIESAVFHEKDCFLYVDLKLTSGIEYKMLDSTALDGIIVTGVDLPVNAQKHLFEIYSVWLDEQRKDKLKECSFKDEFMKTTFSCKTFSGEEYKDIAFRFNRKGELETETAVPEAILLQVIEAWNICDMTGSNHFIQQ